MGSRWMRVDVVMRSIHLYTGLFLAPWMLIYATSGLCLNHHQWFIKQLGVNPPRWQLEREVKFVPEDTFPQAQAEQAQAVLHQVGLDGAHNIIQPQSNRDQMVINRICATGNYRVTWRRPRSLIVVEKQQPFSFYRLLHFLHFRFGYNQRQLAFVVWALLVDVVVISIWLWVVSGFYLWLRRSRKRFLGGACAIAGSVLFIVLVLLLCR